MNNTLKDSNTDLLLKISNLQSQLKALKKEHEQSKLILENTSDNIAITTFDLKAKYLYVSPSVYNILGYQPSDLLGKSFFDFIHKDDKKALLPILKKYINKIINQILLKDTESITETIEFRFRNKAGNWQNMHSTVNLIEKKILAITRDITDRKKSENTLQQKVLELSVINDFSRAVSSKLEINEVLDSALQGIQQTVGTDMAFMFKRIGERLIISNFIPKMAKNKFGIIPEHKVGECFCGIAASKKAPQYSKDIFSDDRCTMEECKKAKIKSFAAIPLLSGNEVSGVIGLGNFNEYDFQPKMEFIETLSAQISIALDNASLYDSLKNELEERKKKEAELSDSERRYRLLASNTQDSIWTTDSSMNLTYVNDAVYDFIGYTSEEMIGLNLSTFTTPEDLQKLSELAHQIRADSSLNKPKTYIIELKQIHKYGHMIDVEISANGIFNSHKELIGFQGRSNDITDRKKLQNELIVAKEKAEESDRLKSAFLANTSHEIRTPMNGILGFASLLKNSELDMGKHTKYVRIIEKSGKRMLNIINDIIDISKVEAGQVDIKISSFSLNELIEDLKQFFTKETIDKGIKLITKIELANADSNITTDKEKLYAILTNLIKNAIKYTNSGSIEFGYTTINERLEFFVMDTGVGIPKERQQAVFDRFVQADIEDKKAMEGSGLGLAITKAYIKLLDGGIRLESEEDKGTKVVFWIPFKKAVLKSDSTHTTPKPNIDNKINILIAEDDDISKDLLLILLADISNKLLLAKTGLETVELCKQNSDIDLIIMDIKMPIMGGVRSGKRNSEV